MKVSDPPVVENEERLRRMNIVTGPAFAHRCMVGPRGGFPHTISIGAWDTSLYLPIFVTRFSAWTAAVAASLPR